MSVLKKRITEQMATTIILNLGSYLHFYTQICFSFKSPIHKLNPKQTHHSETCQTFQAFTILASENFAMRIAVCAISLFFWMSQFSIPVAAQSGNNTYAGLATEILHLINDHRSKMKLKPLAMNEAIVGIAMTHSRNMANGSVEFGHDGFDDRVALMRHRIKQTNSWGENVAYGARSAKEVVTMWLNSPEHRENIEGNYNQTGIAIARGKDGYLYYTQLFCKAK